MAGSGQQPPFHFDTDAPLPMRNSGGHRSGRFQGL